MRYLPLLLVPSLVFADPDKKPPPEVAANPVKLELPAVPKFEAISNSPRELMHVSRPIGKEVHVAGYVVALYRCAKIDTDPTSCERPKLFLGDTAHTPRDKALWVVDYPRAPSKLERERLPKDQLAAWPAVPAIAVGDYVVVHGEFEVKSPHSELNSWGLVVFQGIEKATPPAGRKPIALAEEPIVQLQPVTPPPRAPVDPAKRESSMVELDAGNRYNGAKDFANAVAMYEKSVAYMPENHLAWYGMGGAYAGQANWAKAVECFEHAVALAPDAAMYQMWLGVSRFEAKLDTAREPLLRAVKADPKLWRANYYLGRIARDTGHPRSAAEWFTRAITANPIQSAPYIALAELYHRWDFTQDSMKVATKGIAFVTDDKRTLYFVLGNDMAELKQYNSAIEQFTLAIDANYPRAYFARAQAELAIGDKKSAKRDYEAFAKVGKDGYELQIAEQALAELR